MRGFRLGLADLATGVVSRRLITSAQVGTTTLLRNFHAAHGAKGFVSQGVFPEMLRATYMRVSKFFLFPIAHRAVFNSNPSQGTPLTKAFAGAIVTLPEGAALSPPRLHRPPLLR